MCFRAHRQTTMLLNHSTDLQRTPSPCTGAAASQRSNTWTPRKGSRQRWGCLSPQMPAVSGSSESGSACWSFSSQTAAWSPCGEPDTQLYGINSFTSQSKNKHEQHPLRQIQTFLPIGTIADEFSHLKVQLAGFSSAPQCRAEAVRLGYKKGDGRYSNWKIKSASGCYACGEDEADRYHEQFQNAYRVVGFWCFCNSTVTAGQLSYFCTETVHRKRTCKYIYVPFRK